jgi:ABC-type Fe3+/spermidine/putrescine transport system ATPase subunit
MSEISLTRLSRRFGTVEAVRDVTLAVGEGEFLSLLGPSGSGKSTVLRMIAGFLKPTDGEIRIGGDLVGDAPPEKRGIGYVFQDYALFPHMSVADNVAFGLRARKVAKPDAYRDAERALELAGLSGYGARRPHELSGGERQRVAIARALVIQPRVLLLDEPLGALARMMREQMQFRIKELQSELSVTAIYVTHDQTEALTMSDRVAVMRRGRLWEVGTPEDLYHRPRERFTAEFMGDSNVLEGTLVARRDGVVDVRIAGGGIVPAHVREGVGLSERLFVAVRPEDVEILPADGDGPVAGTIAGRTFRGPVARYHVAIDDGVVLKVDVHGRAPALEPGQPARLRWSHERCAVLRDEGGVADPLPSPEAAALPVSGSPDEQMAGDR